MSRLEELRREYETKGVADGELSADPFAQFKHWFDEALASCSADWFEVNAMTLATCDRDGLVTSRIVLLKSFDQRGFTFFTNYGSEKSQQIELNPQVSLLFHWPFQGRQVRIDGVAARTDRAISKSYFHSRPRGAQIGAIVSRQSSPVASRGELDRLYDLERERLGDRPVPLPEYWGGYTVSPKRMEFWQGRRDRLHDRFQYRMTPAGDWMLQRLFP